MQPNGTNAVAALRAEHHENGALTSGHSRASVGKKAPIARRKVEGLMSLRFSALQLISFSIRSLADN
jgi:hypothetical protein